MVKDYTNIGRKSPTPDETKALSVASGQQIVLWVVYASSAGFFLAGLWLLFGEQTLFPGESARWVGFSLIATAAMDIVAAAVLKHAWQRRSGNLPQ
jgi:hypothetical protein